MRQGLVDSGVRIGEALLVGGEVAQAKEMVAEAMGWHVVMLEQEGEEAQEVLKSRGRDSRGVVTASVGMQREGEVSAKGLKFASVYACLPRRSGLLTAEVSLELPHGVEGLFGPH